MKKFSLILSATLLITLFWFAGVVYAATVSVEIEPSEAHSFNLNVFVNGDISDLYGASVDFIFNPEAAKIIKDSIILESGEDAVLGGQALPNPGFIINRFDNTKGSANFTECQIGNTPRVDLTMIVTLLPVR